MADNKIIAFAVVGLIVGAAIGVGIGFAVFGNKSNDEETYYVYLYLGDNNALTGWYSAKAKDANAGIEKAFEGKEGIEFTWSYGYPVANGASAIYEYLWNDTSKAAADGSNGTYMSGWRSYAAYGDAEEKMDISLSHIFFLSAYGPAPTYDVVTPKDTNLWKTAEGTPFATA